MNQCMFRVQKKINFFDDDVDDDFETFDGDEDFLKMTASKAKTDDPGEPEGKGEPPLGKPWGGNAYSLQKGLNSCYYINHHLC